VNAEIENFQRKLDQIHASGCNVVLNNKVGNFFLCCSCCFQGFKFFFFFAKPIGDFATQFFAKKGIHCSSRLSVKTMKRIVEAVGGCVQVRNRASFLGPIRLLAETTKKKGLH
jgi:hypothetical protein